MNPVLEEILRTGQTQSERGDTIPIHSHISPEEGEFLQELVSETKVVTGLEIGLAYGVSALFICDALQKAAGTRHIVIDPSQFTLSEFNRPGGHSWDGIGLANLRRAGYEQIIEFHGVPSHVALPQLEARGTQIDFAFIDGWHTFDYALVDFFYVDRLLRVGGGVAIDDADFASVRKLCRFIATNRAYSVVRCLEAEPGHRPRLFLKRQLLRAVKHLPGILRRVLNPEIAGPDLELGLVPGSGWLGRGLRRCGRLGRGLGFVSHSRLFRPRASAAWMCNSSYVL